MKSICVLFVVWGVFWPATRTLSEPSTLEPRVGGIIEIRIDRSSQLRRRDGSSGNSGARNIIQERVAAIRPDGLELVYDTPSLDSVNPKEWQFPIHIHRSQSGSLQVLNRSDLENRLENWLKTYNLTRSACGRSIFTWSAFRIECDPQSVIDMIEHIDLRSVDPRPGGFYNAKGTREPAPLTVQASGPDGSTLVAHMEADPDWVRRERAKEDVTVGEIMGRPITLEEALRQRAKGAVSGTISATFDTDPGGYVWRRTVDIKLSVDGTKGQSETQVSTETVERRLLPAR